MLTKLRRVIEERDTVGGRVFDTSIQILIVASLVSFSVETLPGLSPLTRRVLQLFEAGTVAVFSAEYVLRVAVAERKLGFILSFFGLIDLLAILPFYLSTGIDLRSVRAFRLLRLFRAIKVGSDALRLWPRGASPLSVCFAAPAFPLGRRDLLL